MLEDNKATMIIIALGSSIFTVIIFIIDSDNQLLKVLKKVGQKKRIVKL